MARIRTIKPSFFTSLTIANLTVEQRLTFIGLWTHSDDQGRSVYDPRLIKAAIWPLDDRTAADIADDVRALTESSLITHYTVGERSYLVINTWSEHQRINRPVASTLPAPTDDQIVPLTSGDEPSVRTHGALSESSPWEGKGMEGNGKEGKSASRSPRRRTPETTIPDDWAPNATARAKATELGIDVDHEAEQFRNHAAAHDRRCVRWDAAFLTWLGKARPASQGRPGWRTTDRQADILRTEMERAILADQQRDNRLEIGA